MAYEAAAFVCLDTRLADALSHMALSAIIHFHAVPGILFKPTDVFAPDIAAVEGNAILLVYRKMC